MFDLPLHAVAALAVLAVNAESTAGCGPRDEVLSQLAERYREAPVAIGLASNGGLIELLTADTGTTWTLIITAPNGSSCVLAEGEDWQQRPRARLDGQDV